MPNQNNTIQVKAKTGPNSVFTGDDVDPNHPNCKRSIKVAELMLAKFQYELMVRFDQVVGAGLGVDGKRSRLPAAIISGTDSPAGGACTGAADEKAWKLGGKLTDSGDIFIDFSPKGGPKDLLGKWDKDGVVFPDGNKWAKVVAE